MHPTRHRAVSRSRHPRKKEETRTKQLIALKAMITAYAAHNKYPVDPGNLLTVIDRELEDLKEVREAQKTSSND